MEAFVLEPRGPFSLTAAASVVASFPPLRHQPAAAEGVRLGFVLDRTHASVAVTLRMRPDGLVEGRGTGSKDVDAIAKQAARIVSLDHDASTLPDVGKRDRKVGGIMRALDGLRPVCFTSPYESACWAIISQRITTTQAARIVAEVVRRHGEKLELDGPISVFPRPDRLLDIASIPGLPAIKLERLHGVAKATMEGHLDAERLRQLGDVDGPKSLRALPGIGAFWASGVYLRACGIVDVFPDEPLSVAALGRLHGAGDTPSRATLDRLTKPLAPFRMWIAFLLRVATNRGLIAPPSAVMLRGAHA